MSVRQILTLTKEEINDETGFGIAFTRFLIDLIQDMTDLCERNHLSLKSLPAFEIGTNDWHIAML
jgi:hypothetical protein